PPPKLDFILLPAKLQPPLPHPAGDREDPAGELVLLCAAIERTSNPLPYRDRSSCPPLPPPAGDREVGAPCCRSLLNLLVIATCFLHYSTMGPGDILPQCEYLFEINSEIDSLFKDFDAAGLAKKEAFLNWQATQAPDGGVPMHLQLESWTIFNRKHRYMRRIKDVLTSRLDLFDALVLNLSNAIADLCMDFNQILEYLAAQENLNSPTP
ncbi:unnamed protein product, partial [Linum tenue]